MFFEKKIFQLISADMIFKTMCAFFFNKWVSRYLSFDGFNVPKKWLFTIRFIKGTLAQI